MPIRGTCWNTRKRSRRGIGVRSTSPGAGQLWTSADRRLGLSSLADTVSHPQAGEDAIVWHRRPGTREMPMQKTRPAPSEPTPPARGPRRSANRGRPVHMYHVLEQEQRRRGPEDVTMLAGFSPTSGQGDPVASLSRAPALVTRLFFRTSPSAARAHSRVPLVHNHPQATAPGSRNTDSVSSIREKRS